jgi:hypothetical protein
MNPNAGSPNLKREFPRVIKIVLLAGTLVVLAVSGVNLFVARWQDLAASSIAYG